jgi:hypothetical protein
MSLIVGFKIVVVPSLIAAVTLAGRRWGPAVAGWLSGFPIVAGPILFFIAWEQGPAFGSKAALGTVLGIPAVLAFNLAYAWCAVRTAWPLSLIAAMAAYAAASALLLALAPSAVLSIGLAALLLAAGPRLFPRIEGAAVLPPRTNSRTEIMYRMLAAAALVFAVTVFAADMGPRMSGLFAMFPVISIVLASFSHHHCGAGFAVRLLRGVILGWYALTLFFILLYLLLPLLPIVLAFAGAVFAATGVQLATRRYIQS